MTKNSLIATLLILFALIGVACVGYVKLGGGGPGGPPPGDQSANLTIKTGATGYLQSGGTASKTDQSYASTGTDESAVVVDSAGVLSLTNAKITKTGDTSSADNSSFYGLNGAVVAKGAGQLTLAHSTVATNGTGTNGVFAVGTGTAISLTNTTINAVGDGAHGVDATLGGVLTLDNVTIHTTGDHAASIATDRGGGSITVQGGSFTTTGLKSPGVYSTGNIVVSGATITGTKSEVAVVEGTNSVKLVDTEAQGAANGVMVYQSFSGDAQGQEGVFTMQGGSLTATNGALFYVTNTTSEIKLTNVKVRAASGTLLKASVDQWGNSGSNGGKVTFAADTEQLTGDVVADSASTIALHLQNNSTLTGTVNTAALSLDATSKWNVTGDSALTSLADGSGIAGMQITNIVGNGHTVTYDKSLAANSALGGKTYNLVNGGTLMPK